MEIFPIEGLNFNINSELEEMNLINRKLSLVYNPVAGGGGSLKKVKKLVNILKDKNIDVDVFSTLSGSLLVSSDDQKQILKSKYLIIAGGDGSLNQVVNLLRNNMGDDLFNVFISVFPSGSGNDWATAWDFSSHVQKWCSNFLRGNQATAQLADITIENELGTNKQLAANSIGVGVTGDIMQRLYEGRVKRSSKAAYLSLTLKAFFNYKYPEFFIAFDGNYSSERILTANIGLNPTTGGGMRLFPQNRRSDGLGLTIVKKPRALAVPSLLWELYFGDVSKAKNFVKCMKAEEIQIVAKSEKMMEVDGERHLFNSISTKLSSYQIKVFGFGN